MSVSLWCEEVDEERNQNRTSVPLAGASRLRAGWDPSASGRRVIQRLLQVEQRYAPSGLYISLIQQEPEGREDLAQWALEVASRLARPGPAAAASPCSLLLQVCCDCGCDEAVFPLAVSLMDRFLSASLALPVWPVCLAAGCILIASKLAGCDSVTAETLCAAAQHHFQPCDLRVSHMTSTSTSDLCQHLKSGQIVLNVRKWDIKSCVCCQNHS